MCPTTRSVALDLGIPTKGADHQIAIVFHRGQAQSSFAFGAAGMSLSNADEGKLVRGFLQIEDDLHLLRHIHLAVEIEECLLHFRGPIDEERLHLEEDTVAAQPPATALGATHADVT